MRITAAALLTAFVFAAGASAQTEAQPAKPEAAMDKLWKIEATGING